MFLFYLVDNLEPVKPALVYNKTKGSWIQLKWELSTNDCTIKMKQFVSVNIFFKFFNLLSYNSLTEFKYTTIWVSTENYDIMLYYINNMALKNWSHLIYFFVPCNHLNINFPLNARQSYSIWNKCLYSLLYKALILSSYTWKCWSI